MGILNKPNTFTANTTASASEVNDNFDTIYNEFNGNISTANLANNAVTTDKIADSNVTTAKIAASAVTTAKMDDNYRQGWIDPNETWTYASASTFTVPGDVTARYTKGTRLKFTQTTVKYLIVASSSYSAPNTTVTIMVNTDYVLANAAISSNFYSYAVNPSSFPTFFNYTAALTNVSGGTVNVSRFFAVGDRVYLDYRYTLAGAGISGAILVGTPVAASSTYHAGDAPIGAGYFLDAAAQVYVGIPTVTSSTINLKPSNSAATYSAYGVATSSTIPFTWGNGDSFGFAANYIMA